MRWQRSSLCGLQPAVYTHSMSWAIDHTSPATCRTSVSPIFIGHSFNERLSGWLHTESVAHPITNGTIRRITSLIDTSPLPLY